MAPTLYYYIYYVHQVQVFHDLLGLYDKKVPRFSHQFARLEGPMTAALQARASLRPALRAQPRSPACPALQPRVPCSPVGLALQPHVPSLQPNRVSTCTPT